MQREPWILAFTHCNKARGSHSRSELSQCNPGLKTWIWSSSWPLENYLISDFAFSLLRCSPFLLISFVWGDIFPRPRSYQFVFLLSPQNSKCIKEALLTSNFQFEKIHFSDCRIFFQISFVWGDIFPGGQCAVKSVLLWKW